MKYTLEFTAEELELLNGIVQDECYEYRCGAIGDALSDRISEVAYNALSDRMAAEKEVQDKVKKAAIKATDGHNSNCKCDPCRYLQYIIAVEVVAKVVGESAKLERKLARLQNKLAHQME